MRYFKNTNNEFFGIDIDQDHLIKPDWVEVTQEDIDAANAPTSEQLKQYRILELKTKLAETDYKDLPSYDKRDTPEWLEVIQQRQAWRNEIRQIEQST